MYLVVACSDGTKRSLGRDRVSARPAARNSAMVRAWPAARHSAQLRTPPDPRGGSHCATPRRRALPLRPAAAGLHRRPRSPLLFHIYRFPALPWQVAPAGRTPTVVAAPEAPGGAPGARYFSTLEYQGLDVLADLFGTNPGAVINPSEGTPPPFPAGGSAQCPPGGRARRVGLPCCSPSSPAAALHDVSSCACALYIPTCHGALGCAPKRCCRPVFQPLECRHGAARLDGEGGHIHTKQRADPRSRHAIRLGEAAALVSRPVCQAAWQPAPGHARLLALVAAASPPHRLQCL